MTAILSLPLAEVEFVCSTNEDWRDSVAMTPNGTPVSLLGITFVMAVKDQPPAHTSMATLSTADGTLIIGGASNEILSIALPRTQVERIGPGTKFVDCIGIADGAYVRCLKGTLVVEQGITPTT